MSTTLWWISIYTNSHRTRMPPGAKGMVRAKVKAERRVTLGQQTRIVHIGAISEGARRRSACDGRRKGQGVRRAGKAYLWADKSRDDCVLRVVRYGVASFTRAPGSAICWGGVAAAAARAAVAIETSAYQPAQTLAMTLQRSRQNTMGKPSGAAGADWLKCVRRRLKKQGGKPWCCEVGARGQLPTGATPVGRRHQRSISASFDVTLSRALLHDQTRGRQGCA